MNTVTISCVTHTSDVATSCDTFPATHFNDARKQLTAIAASLKADGWKVNPTSRSPTPPATTTRRARSSSPPALASPTQSSKSPASSLPVLTRGGPPNAANGGHKPAYNAE